MGAKGSAKSALPVATDKGDAVANLEAWGDWRMEAFDDTPGVLLVNVRSYVNACYCLILSIIYEICATIFSAKNFKISNDRTGLTRSAVFLIFFIVVHAVGNLHVFKGPDDFNGYGYFYVRLYWTGFGFQANIVEEYVLLSALLHIFVGLKRTWDQKLSSGLMSGQLNLAITGLMLLTFMTIHLFQFRFADTEQYFLRPPPTLINWHPSWLITLTFFWTDNKQVPLVPVRDIFLKEYKVLKNPVWCGFYIMAVLIFMTTPASDGEAHVGTIIRYSQEASVLCEVLRIPHFLGDRFDIHFFPGFRVVDTTEERSLSKPQPCVP